MNEIDKKILSQLQEDADIPIAELSKKVNLSATPCWARINKLYKEGYIKKKVAVADRNKLNLKTIAFVSIRTNKHNMEWAKKFISIINSMPEVVEFYRLSGSIDYLLKVLVPTMEEYTNFIQNLQIRLIFLQYQPRFQWKRLSRPQAFRLITSKN